MKRQPLLALLEQYEKDFPRESDVVIRFRRFVEEHPDCFERSLLEGHVTGSCWLVDRERKRTLLTHHRKMQIWIQLGGHCDGDPDVLDVALREAVEESGLDSVRAVNPEKLFHIDIVTVPAWKDIPQHLHYDVRFLFEADINESLHVTPESIDLKWIPLNEVQDWNSELTTMVEKMLI